HSDETHDAPPLEERDTIAETEATEYLRGVSHQLHQQGVSSVECRVVRGSPANVIIDLARDIPDNLVAMTTHGRSGIARWVLGSVTDRVVRHSSVLVLN
ncbi:MAG: universal stress protein, partial [Anaerolineae bacterium]